jgi:ankyrin repeat protein
MRRRSRTFAIVLGAVLAVLALTWPVLGKRYALAFASLHPEFWYVRAGAGDDRGHFGRVVFGCSNWRVGVLVLHAAGFRDPRHPYKPVSAMVCAAGNGHVDMLKLLAWLGDDVNSVTIPFGEHSTLVTTPLGAAMAAKQLAAAEFLLQHGASPALPAREMPTAIHAAARVRCLPCFELLHRYKADVNVPEPTLPVVTWLDSRAETRDVLEWLEQYGVRMDRTGADGRSALHAAAGASDIAVVEWLLQKGLDPLARDATGMTPLMYAGYMNRRANGRLPVALRLLEVTPDLTTTSTGSNRRPEPPPVLTLPDIRGWKLERYAAEEPRFREAAQAAGKALQ